jgi:hypothetical protein
VVLLHGLCHSREWEGEGGAGVAGRSLHRRRIFFGDAGCRMPDAGRGRPPGARRGRPADAGCRMPDAGCRMPGAGCRARTAPCGDRPGSSR